MRGVTWGTWGPGRQCTSLQGARQHGDCAAPLRQGAAGAGAGWGRAEGASPAPSPDAPSTAVTRAAAGLAAATASPASLGHPVLHLPAPPAVVDPTAPSVRLQVSLYVPKHPHCPPASSSKPPPPPPAMLGPDNPHQCIPQYLLLFYNAHSVSPSQCSWLSPTECPGFLSASGFTPSPSSEFPTALGVPMALGVSTIPVSPWLGHSCSLGTPSTSLWLSPSSWCPVLWYPQGVPTPWVPHPQVSSCCSQPVVAPSWGAPEHPCGGTSQKGCVPAEIPAVTPRLTARNQTSFRVSWPRPSMPVDGYQVALIPMVSWGQGQGLGCVPSRAVSPVW